MKKTQWNSSLRCFFKTMLEIIEDRPNFIIPEQIYILAILFYFLQISGYIFCTSQIKVLNEQLFLIFAHINEISTITFLLTLKGYDLLTYVFFGLINLIQYTYFIYILSLTILKKYNKLWVNQNRNWIKKINQSINIFFTFYYWAFQTPFLEINIGILSCNENSFLLQYRQKNCSDKPIFLVLLAAFGAILSVSTGLTIMFFFRNYEFFERILLKRKFNKWQIPQLLSYFLFLYIYYMQSLGGSIQYIASQIVGIIQLSDLIINYPFRDSMISKLYVIGCSYFQVSMTAIVIWIYVDTIYDTDLFYIMALATMLLSYLLYVIQNNQRDNILLLTSDNFNKLYMHLDFYLEELVRFGIDQQKNEFNRFKLFQLLGYHKQTCVFSDCYCKQSNFKDEKDNLDYQALLVLVDDIFQRYLKDKIISKNNFEREHLYLKYISFIANFRCNPIRAYHQLKSYLAHTKVISFYFLTISKVLSQNIEKLIHDKQNAYSDAQHETGLVEFTQVRDEVTTKEVEQTETIKNTFVPLFQNFLASKVEYWQKTKGGFSTIEEFYQHTVNFSKNSLLLKEKFQTFLTKNNQHIQLENNAIISKIISIYKCVVMNQLQISYKFETQYLNLKKRDYSKPFFIINQFNLSQKDVQIIRISIAKERGKILGKSNQGIANFFGYNLKDYEQLQSINQLMPAFISTRHNYLINNMIQRGVSSYIRNRKHTFTQDQQGFLLPINIQIDNYHQIFNDFCMFAALLKLRTQSQYIIFDSMGKIQGISRKIFFQVFKERFNKNQQTAKLKQQNHFKRDSAIKNEIVNLSSVLQRLNVFILMPILTQHIQKFISLIEKEESSKDIKNQKKFEQLGRLQFPIKAFELSDKLTNIYQTKTPQDITQQKIEVTKQEETNSVDPLQENNSPLNSFQMKKHSLHNFEQFYENNLEEWDQDQIYSSTNIKYQLEIKQLNYFQDSTHKNYVYYVMEIVNMKDSFKESTIEKSSRQNLDERLTIQETDSEINSSLMDSELFSPQTNFENINITTTKKEQENFPSIKCVEDITSPKNNNYQQELMSPSNKQISFIFKEQIVTCDLLHLDEDATQNTISYMDGRNQQFQSNRIIQAEKNKCIIGSYNKTEAVSPSRTALILSPTLSNGIGYSSQFLSGDKQSNFGENQIISDPDLKVNPNFLQPEIQQDRKYLSNRISFTSLHKKRVSQFKKQIEDITNISSHIQEQAETNIESDLIKKKQQELSFSRYKHAQKKENKIKQLITRKDNEKDIDAQRSQSYYSSTSSFRNLSNHLLQSIIGKTNTIFSLTIQIFSSLYIIFFALMSIIIGLVIFMNIKDVANEIGLAYQYSHYYPLISNQTLNSLNKFTIDNNIMTDTNSQLELSLYQKCQEMRALYLIQFEDRFKVLTQISPNDNSINFDIVTFSNKQENKINVGLINLQYKILQSSLMLCPNEMHGQDNFDINLYFLLKNSQGIYQAGQEITNYLFSEIEQKKSNLTDSFLILGICCISITTLQIFFSAIGLRQFNRYKKNILILIGRVSVEEIDTEIIKLTQCLNCLKNISEDWMNQDFVEIMLLNQSDIDANSETRKKMKESSFKGTFFNNSKVQSQKKLTSLIKNHRFPYLRQILITTFFCLSGSIILMIIVLIASMRVTNFTSFLSLYKKTFQTADEFSQTLLLSEYLATSPALALLHPEFPQITDISIGDYDEDSAYELLKQQINNTKSYFSDILKQMDGQSQLSDNYKQEIINLLQKDMCILIGDDYQRICKYSKSTTVREIAKQGTIALFSEFFQYFASNDFFYLARKGDSITQDGINKITNYVNSNQHFEYIVNGFNIGVKSLELLKNYLNLGFQECIDELIKLGYIYLICLCLPFMVCWIILSTKIKNRIKKQIINISFSLTLIPYEKLQEDNTIIFLKKIKKF